MTILINNRVIKNSELLKTINEAYYNYVVKDRYPYIILNIQVDPFLVDVNVHPTKMEVKFSKLNELKQLIFDTITNKLSEKTLIPKAKSDIIEDNFDLEIKSDKTLSNSNKELRFNFSDTKNNFLEVKEEFAIYNNQDVKSFINKSQRLKPMKAIAIIHKTFIVCENDEGMYLVDQHAAAERINYEKVLDSITNHSDNIIDVLIPYKVELSKAEYLILEKNFYLLDRLGFYYEEFSDNTILIRRHPAWISSNKTFECIKKIIDIIIDKEEFDEKKFLDRVAASVACRMSIMAGDYITLDEANTLIEELRKTNNPFNCAHGRPSIVSYTNYELDKMFKRVL